MVRINLGIKSVEYKSFIVSSVLCRLALSLLVQLCIMLYGILGFIFSSGNVVGRTNEVTLR